MDPPGLSFTEDFITTGTLPGLHTIEEEETTNRESGYYNTESEDKTVRGSGYYTTDEDDHFIKYTPTTRRSATRRSAFGDLNVNVVIPENLLRTIGSTNTEWRPSLGSVHRGSDAVPTLTGIQLAESEPARLLSVIFATSTNPQHNLPVEPQSQEPRARSIGPPVRQYENVFSHSAYDHNRNSFERRSGSLKSTNASPLRRVSSVRDYFSAFRFAPRRSTTSRWSQDIELSPGEDIITVRAEEVVENRTVLALTPGPDGAAASTSDVRKGSIWLTYEKAKAKGVALQRKLWAQKLFEFSIYFILILFIYFVLVGLPLWKGAVYWLW